MRKLKYLHFRLFSFGKQTDKRQHYGIRSVLITLLSVVLAHCIIYNLEDITTFASPNSSGDFEISDIYNAISDFRNTSIASSEVTVVNIDNCTRQEVLDVLEVLSEYAPSVIGLDIFFRVASPDSLQLLQRLKDIPNLVIPCIVESSEESVYYRADYSFIEKHLTENCAFVNLNASSPRSIIRDFSPMKITSSGDSLLYMATFMTKIASPEKYEKLIHRNNQNEIIKFSSIDIPIISAEELLNGHQEDYLSRHLTKKAILVGDIHNINDMYSTPLKDQVPGVVIHAYSLNTILSNLYTTISPQWLNYLIAIILCFFFIYANLVVKEKWNNIGGLLLRLLQIMLIFSIVLLGSRWYNTHLQYIDFSLLVLMIGLCSLSSDICDGLYALKKTIKTS